MYCVAVFIIVGALCGWPVGVEGVDCNDQASMRNEMTKCFGQLVSEIGSVDEMQSTIQKDVGYACGHLDEYRTGLSCVMAIARNCLVTLGQDPDVLPDPDKMSDGLGYLCQNIEGFDNQCLQDKQPSIYECIQDRAAAVGRTSSDRSARFIYCTAFDLTLDCTETQLASCPEKTRDVFVEYTKYSIPPACGACASGASCLLLLFAALLAIACRYSDV